MFSMGFWPRIGCAVVCWFLSMLILITMASHYITSMPSSSELWLKILLTLAVGAGGTAATFAVLYFWLWLWIGRQQE